jgi:hypothetical protein
MMISTHASWRAGLCAAAIAFAGAGCGPNIDVAAALRLESVTTGWVDVGPVGQSPAAHERTNKVVPSVSFMVKNVTDRTLAPVQVNAVFRRLGDPSEWTNGTAQAAGSDGLELGSARELTLRRRHGRGVRALRVAPVGPDRRISDRAPDHRTLSRRPSGLR